VIQEFFKEWNDHDASQSGASAEPAAKLRAQFVPYLATINSVLALS